MNRHVLRLKRSNSNRGFSLVEMITVVVIIGVLAAIAAPGWLAFANHHHARVLQDQVRQVLRSTQALARQTLRKYSVVMNYDTDPPTMEVYRIERTTLPPTLMRSEQLGDGQYDPGVLSIQTNATGIYFDHLGNVTDQDGEAPTTLPIVITIQTPPENDERYCYVVETLLGAMRAEYDRESDPIDQQKCRV